MTSCLRAWLAVAAAALALNASAKTKVVFFFDTEDFIQPRSADAIRDIANILASEGVRGHFAMIGYLGQKLVEWRRTDVLDALNDAHHATYRAPSGEMCDVAITSVSYTRHRTWAAVSISMIEEA